MVMDWPRFRGAGRIEYYFSEVPGWFVMYWRYLQSRPLEDISA